jgi:hypothetical protein
MSEVLRDQYGNRLGEIVIEGQRRIIRDKYGRTLGWYDAYDNITKDRQGRWVGRGDLLSRLLEEGS